MKRIQANAILSELSNRRNNIIKKAIVLLICVLLTIVAFSLNNKENQPRYVNYKENTNITYDVDLKENEFFKDGDTKNNGKYIASLIEYINGNYDYELVINEKNVPYIYSYLIEMEVDIKEPNSDKTIYHTVDKLVNRDEKVANSNTNLKINEQVKIDYNYYNDLVKKFVNTYGLTEVESTLEAKLHIFVKETETSTTPNETILTISLPLTTKTVGVDIKNNVIEASDSVLVMEEPAKQNSIFTMLGCILLLVDLILAGLLVKYILDTRSAQSLYETELNKILNNYHSYIQKVSAEEAKPTGDDVKLYELETFTDMLEIRDNLNSPILMFQDAENTITQFRILDINNKAVYIYTLRAK